ncbi:MAG: DUF4136 domain-containing protein [Bacteroidetes bacterium]|nr:DUF4136 domain-containing protein [Bacteroidota bacterium]
MKKRSRLLSMLLLSVLLSGCANLAIQRDYDDSASFVIYKTFSWIPAKNTQDVPGPYRDDGLLDKRIKQAVASSLVEQGYTEQSNSTPDFYVVYRVGLKEKTRNSYFGSGYYGYGSYGFGYGGYGFPYRYRRSFFGYGGFGYGYPYYGGGLGRYGTYTEGTLVIDILDAKTDELVWRGSAVSRMSDPAYDAKEINKVVEKILEEFPPRPYPSKSPDSRRVIVAS